MSEVCADAAYLVDPYNEMEIADGLENLLTNTALRQQYQSRGKRHASTYSWQRVAKETAALYQHIANDC
jgi:glycosyltransferase involved in cell wall biosynthesis